jgi:hypothetical protein
VVALVKAGVQIIQSPAWEPGKASVSTTLVHASGEWISLSLSLPVGGKGETPQGVASAITYARRYGLMAILGIAAGDEDDDGEEAERPYRRPDPPHAGLVRGALDDLAARRAPRDAPTPDADPRDYGPPEVESELIARAMRGTYVERIAQATLADLSPSSALGHEIGTRVKDPDERAELRRAWDARRAELRAAEAAETEARR